MVIQTSILNEIAVIFTEMLQLLDAISLSFVCLVVYYFIFMNNQVVVETCSW